MPAITNITIQKRNHERVNIYLDDEFAFGLTAVAAASLKIGMEMTPALQASLDSKEELEKARTSAFKLISMRPRSVAELRQKFRAKKLDDAVIEQVTTDLVVRGYLDDAAFAKFWVDQRETFKPSGIRALQNELRQKGVSGKIIDDVLSDLDEVKNAKKAAASRIHRWQALPAFELKKKLSGFLQRRGFSFETIYEVIEQSLSDRDTEFE